MNHSEKRRLVAPGLLCRHQLAPFALAVAVRLAGLDRQAFDEILFASHLSPYDEETLAEDLETLRSLGLR